MPNQDKVNSVWILANDPAISKKFVYVKIEAKITRFEKPNSGWEDIRCFADPFNIIYKLIGFVCFDDSIQQQQQLQQLQRTTAARTKEESSL